MLKIYFERGKRVNTWRGFYPNGNLCSEYIYEADTLIEQSVYYPFGSDSIPAILIERIQYQLSGADTIHRVNIYYENGNPFFVTKLVNEQRDSNEVIWYKNGDLWSNMLYQSDTLLKIAAYNGSAGAQQDNGNFKEGNGELFSL